MSDYFNDNGEAVYETAANISAFKRIENCALQGWTDEQKRFLIGVMKMAFYDGVYVGKLEAKKASKDLYDAIEAFLGHG